ncbi:MAG: DUF4159 domain-containing protein [Phycisphaeraceae bacterium]
MPRPRGLPGIAIAYLRTPCCLLITWLCLLSGAAALAQTAPPPTPKTAPQPAPQPVKQIGPEDLTPQLVRSAIDRAMAALHRLEPEYTILPAEYYRLYQHNRHEIVHAMGNHALACWALLAAGDSYQNPKLQRRINWVLSRDQAFTYDRGMRARMLSMMPPQSWGPWVNRDQIWLMGAMTDTGNFGADWTGTPIVGAGDNANGQYGVLGLWATEESGWPVSRDVWEKVDAYWRAAQEITPGDEPAGWAVYARGQSSAAGKRTTFYNRTSGPMTAGAVASLFIAERQLHGNAFDSNGQVNLSPQFTKGLRWLDERFSAEDQDEAADRYYYYWCIQQVGTTTGYRTFNNVDWFRTITARILNEQQPDGTFTGRQGRLISTGFALLYLAKAFDPLAVSKIRLRDDKGQTSADLWNRRPHDIWNFVDYASDLYEVSTTWSACELSQPVYQLMESPLLYLSIDRPVTFPEEHVAHLRQYLDAGGMLVVNLESNNATVLASIRELARKVRPNLNLELAPRNHPIYTVNHHLPPSTQMLMASNGVRPLILCFPQDLGKALQANDPRARDAFDALSNIYLYAIGRSPRRTRLITNYLRALPRTPSRKLTGARIKYEGNYNPEPAALQQLKTFLANDCNVDLQVTEAAPEALAKEQIAFLTTLGQGAITNAQAQSLRHWLEAGGTLWLDACAGGAEANTAAETILQQLAPNAVPVPLSRDHPIITGKGLPRGLDNEKVYYRAHTILQYDLGYRSRLLAIHINDRPAIIFSPQDLTCALAGLEHWQIDGYRPDSARRLVANGCLLTLQKPVE